MADFIVSSILDLVKPAILDKATEEVNLLVGVEEEVQKLERKFNLIRGVLDDADAKKFEPGNKSLKIWLDSLKEACYDMEDAVAMWRIGAAQKARSTLRKKVCGFLSCFSPQEIGRRHALAHKIKEINKLLDEIDEGRAKYKLEERETNQQLLKAGRENNRETSSVVESVILGRELEKDIVLGHLGVNVSSDVDDGLVKTISLVGMGGLGKTAMAKLVYNDQAVEGHFGEARIWVCVSDVFDEKKVAKAIIQGLEKVSGAATQGLENDSWDVLLQRISESIKKKKFFLVLDDVWGDKREKWEELITCFKKGARGSRILVTTRSADVARMMGSSKFQTIELEKLGDEVCWSIIKQRALKERHGSEKLEQVGREIAAKCKGLPLAAKTLGSLLEDKEDTREWENVLNSQVWNLDSVPEKVFAPLLLSYYDLPLEVRRCFLFCVFYPKDTDIVVSELINYWMSLDYLGFGSYDDLELKGRKYFNLLANRSFFQDFQRRNEIERREITDGTKIVVCKMHDLVHDFAKYLVENEFVTEIIQPTDDHPRSIKLEKCRHLRMSLEGSSSFPAGSISGAKSLRSLGISFAEDENEDQHAVAEGLSSLLRQSKVLRLLELDEPPLACLSDQVGNLNHLRQLTLYSESLRQLPEALSNLHQLIILDLKGCQDLEELPGWIGKLKNLRSLDTLSCRSLKKYPKEMGQLTLLECLHGAVVRVDCCNDDGEEFSWADVGKLRQLRIISIEKVKGEEVVNVEAAAAQLSNLRELWVYKRACEESSVVDFESFLETMKMHLPSSTAIDTYIVYY